jgi:hypothetical protein
MKQVVILMTDDNRGLWSIYEESGQALELDFDSEEDAAGYALDQGFERVLAFNSSKTEYTIGEAVERENLIIGETYADTTGPYYFTIFRYKGINEKGHRAFDPTSNELNGYKKGPDGTVTFMPTGSPFYKATQKQ